eukprot:11206879-Lingulodinium_polyedra.AAC.1
MEPVCPLVVEPVCKHRAVELGWPGHLGLLLPEVTTQVPFGLPMSSFTTPPGPGLRWLKGMMTTLHTKRCVNAR